MASHLSLTTVIFSLLRRYYIRVTEISRSMTSTCCCCCCYTFVVAIPHAIARSRFVEIESNRYLFNPFRRVRSSCPESSLDFTFLSDPTIRAIEFHTHLNSRKKKERKFNKRIVIAHVLHRVQFWKFEIQNQRFLWKWIFFFENEKWCSVENENTFQIIVVIFSLDSRY